jgi:hypothetical protein
MLGDHGACASQLPPNTRPYMGRSMLQRVVDRSSKTVPEQPNRDPVHHPATARKALTCAFNPKVPGSRPGRPTEQPHQAHRITPDLFHSLGRARPPVRIPA